MKEKLVDALVNLLKVASLISLAAIVVFVRMSFRGELDTAYVKEILMLVFVFYFGTKQGKQQAEEESKSEALAKLPTSTSGYMIVAPKEDEDEHFDSDTVASAIGFEIEDPELEFREDEPEGRRR